MHAARGSYKNNGSLTQSQPNKSTKIEKETETGKWRGKDRKKSLNAQNNKSFCHLFSLYIPFAFFTF